MAREVTETNFLGDVAKHAITILRDEGLYRHLHFAIPGNGHMHFDIVTYPHFLCYSGDMGCYVFSRIPDMFQFFRGHESGPLRINEGYWGEKIEAADKPDGWHEYSPEKLEAYVNEWLTEVEADQDLRDEVRDSVLAYAQDGEYPAMQALTEFEHEQHRPFQDCWERGFRGYTFRFTWCCYALVWGIRQYDAAKERAKS